MQSLIIDNTGFNVEAMSAITEKEFVDIHIGTADICKGKPDAFRRKYLKDCYKKILHVAKPGVTPDSEKPESESHE